ncbi:hypothetical protein WDU94_000482, partial [Cyamophila willieti]
LPRLLFIYYVHKQDHRNQVVETYISYPRNSNRNNGIEISCVEAYDRHSNPAYAGYASITSGGVGDQSVTLHLESRRGYELIYLVRIWGH